MRALTESEAQILAKILGGVPGTAPLIEQLGSVRVKDDSTPTYLTLVTRDSVAATGFRDGPLPGRFPVRQGGHLVGEILVWLEDGRLAGLEYAWATPEAPHGMPDAAEVEVDDA